MTNALLTLLAGTALALTACGGGGGSTTAKFIPPPTGTQLLVADPPVTIFATPQVGTYSSEGASWAGQFGNNSNSPDTRFSGISAAAADEPNIRYTAEGHYEVQFPTRDWSMLVQDSQGRVGAIPADNPSFKSADGLGTFSVDRTGYRYSQFADWNSAVLGRAGIVAFGVPTPPSGVPLSGSGTYAGTVSGMTDIYTADHLAGGYSNWGVRGTVDLSFDFGAGSLAGSMTLSLDQSLPATSLGSWSFKNPVFAPGSSTYSGKFDSVASGQNFFQGRFTGPNAEETIGAWAVPFIFSQGDTYIPADGQVHQAVGAWIARKGP